MLEIWINFSPILENIDHFSVHCQSEFIYKGMKKYGHIIIGAGAPY